MNSANEWLVLVLVFVCTFATYWIARWRTIEEMQREAAAHGRAEFIANKDGSTTFKWKDEK